MALATTSGKGPCKSLKDELISIIGNGFAWHFAEEIFSATLILFTLDSSIYNLKPLQII